MPKSAAFFDLDRTLMSGSSAYIFRKACYRAGVLPFPRLLGDAYNAMLVRVFGPTDEKSEALRARILEGVAGHGVATFKAFAPSLTDELLARVRPEAQALLDMHQEAGRDVYIISASPVEIVSELARALDIAGGLGTESEIVDGVYTGRLAAPFCYGEGKAEVVRNLAAERGYDLSACYAYADSASDLPILQLVGHPVAVNPDRSLLSVAHRRGWPIVEFHRQGKQIAKLSATGAAGLAASVGGYVLGRRRGFDAAERQRAARGRRLLPGRA
jgi:HAD superfamily hydrolase (TIGR01490 family)